MTTLTRVAPLLRARPPGVLAISPSGCSREKLDLHVKTDSSPALCSLHPSPFVFCTRNWLHTFLEESTFDYKPAQFLQPLGKLQGEGLWWVCGVIEPHTAGSS